MPDIASDFPFKPQWGRVEQLAQICFATAKSAFARLGPEQARYVFPINLEDKDMLAKVAKLTGELLTADGFVCSSFRPVRASRDCSEPGYVQELLIVRAAPTRERAIDKLKAEFSANTRDHDTECRHLARVHLGHILERAKEEVSKLAPYFYYELGIHGDGKKVADVWQILKRTLAEEGFEAIGLHNGSIWASSTEPGVHGITLLISGWTKEE